MRLLCISYAFPPQVAPRAIQVARLLSFLAGRGHAVCVVTAHPEQTGYLADPGLGALVAPGITVERTWTVEGRTLGRVLMAAGAPDGKLLWGLAAARATRRRLAEGEALDALCTFAQPFTAHLVGLRLRRATGLPWLAHCSDPWSDNPYLAPYGPWHRSAQRALERRVVRAADRIAVVSAAHAEGMARAHGEGVRRRLVVLPHAYDTRAYPPAQPPDPQIFVLAHVGNFYGARTPEPLLQAAARLGESGRRLRLCFVGGYPPWLPARLRELGLADRTDLVGPVGYSESLRWIRSADLLVAIDAPADGDSLFLPSKLIEYVGSGRPVLGITPVSGEVATTLTRLGLPVRSPQDVEGIRALLAGYLNGSVPLPAVPPPVEFDIETVGKQFEELLLALVGHGREGRS